MVNKITFSRRKGPPGPVGDKGIQGKPGDK
ncbi:uncharacterized protein METZ01_LOCUS338146, partial [marine metagenome]